MATESPLVPLLEEGQEQAQTQDGKVDSDNSSLLSNIKILILLLSIGLVLIMLFNKKCSSLLNEICFRYLPSFQNKNFLGSSRRNDDVEIDGTQKTRIRHENNL